MLIQKVWYSNTSKVKLVTIPKASNIKPGEYVKIEKIEGKFE